MFDKLEIYADKHYATRVVIVALYSSHFDWINAKLHKEKT